MTVTEIPADAATVRARINALAPSIADRAAESEAARRLPPDLLRDLIDAGCFRLMLPASHGGIGADLPAALDVFAALARADGSVGWIVAIGASQWCDLVGLPRETFDMIYADGPDTTLAGAFSPSGNVVAADGGYCVTGRWGFASGCEHAEWLFGNCVEAVVDGMPVLRAALFRRDEVVIEDTWHVVGLRGTGSHHFHASDVFVPAERTFQPLAEDPCLDAPIVHVPIPTLFALEVAAVATGIAEGALADIIDLAREKVPLLDRAPLATSATFQSELANADTTLRAARALLASTATDVWATAAGGGETTMDQVAAARAAATWATGAAADVTRAAYRAGGGTAIYADCALQRRLRDAEAVTQHFLVKRDTMRLAGAALAGREVDAFVF